MNKSQYRRALEYLRFNQQQAADALGISLRSSNGYANGVEIPERVSKALKLLIEREASGGPQIEVTLSRRPLKIIRGRPGRPRTKPLSPVYKIVQTNPSSIPGSSGYRARPEITHHVLATWSGISQ